MMYKIDNLPPLPWSYQTSAPEGAHLGNGFVYLLDANGRKIASFWGKPAEKIALAELICSASDLYVTFEREHPQAGTHNNATS